MKIAIRFQPLVAVAALFFCLQHSGFAQKSATWKGGTPGKSTDWNCPTNWLESRIPNEFSDVIIPDLSTTGAGSGPVICRDADGVNSLTLRSGARLVIEKTGCLTVFEALEILGNAELQNNGLLFLPGRNDPHSNAKNIAGRAAEQTGNELSQRLD